MLAKRLRKMEKGPPSIPAPLRDRGVLARRLGVSFARVVVVATAVCALLLVLLVRVGGYVRQMQHDETAIRQGLELAAAIREQYIHAAHSMVVGDESHMAHYDQWVEHVRVGVVALRDHVPPNERPRLDRIAEKSARADSLFRQEVLPALSRNETEKVREAHRRIEALFEDAASDADAVARIVEADMSHAHVDTTRVTYAAGALAVAGIVALVLLSSWSTRRLRAAVLRPLAALVEAARKIGAGDLKARVGAASDDELGVVSAAFDRMAEQLLEHEHRLVASERMAAIGQLAAGVAHEINNPIGVIRGYLKTMIPEAERAELKNELRILDEEASACQRIAEDLVAYARSPELSKQSVEIESLLHQVAERFEASGESKECSVRVRVQPGLVELDPLRMRQVIQNLLRNAVQASPTAADIELLGEVSNGGYVIRVRDRGLGIPQELRTRIFEPFVSGKPTGTGLGLAVCDGIVRAHKGTIEVRARDGSGEEFVVTLPRDADRPGQEVGHV